MKPYVIRRIASKEYYCIFPPFFLRFRVDEREGFEYATCGRVFFKKRRKNLPFSKLSGQVWKHPRSQVLSPTRHSVGTGRKKPWERGWYGTGLRGCLPAGMGGRRSYHQEVPRRRNISMRLHAEMLVCVNNKYQVICDIIAGAWGKKF